MRRWRQNTSAFRLRARPTDHANTLFCLSLRGESSQRGVALVTIYDWYTRRRCFNFLLAWLHHYLCHSLRITSNIRYSLAGQDTRLSPERPGLESRCRKSFRRASASLGPLGIERPSRVSRLGTEIPRVQEKVAASMRVQKRFREIQMLTRKLSFFGSNSLQPNK